MHSCIWRLRQVNKEDRIFHFVWLFTSTCSLSLKDHCILLPILSFCCCCFRREGKFSPIAPSWPQVSLSALFLVKKIIDYDTTCMIRHFSHVRLFVTPWTEACQAPLSMGFSRQECWSGLPCPSPEDLPNPEIEPGSPALTDGFFTAKPPGKPI